MKKTNVADTLKEEDLPAAEEIEGKLDDLASKAPPPLPRAMAVKDGTPQNSRINIRGDPKKLGDEVLRGFIKVVASPESALPGGPKRSVATGRLDRE